MSSIKKMSFYLLFSNKSFLQYVRLHDDIDTEHAKELLVQHWAAPEPDLLISIIGNNKLNDLEEKLTKRVANGLSQVSVLQYFT